MEIGDTIVMIQNIVPDFLCVRMIAVKGPIHKFYLSRLVIEKKLQFFSYLIHIAETHRFIDGRKAITAAVRTPPGRFIVNDAVFKKIQIII